MTTVRAAWASRTPSWLDSLLFLVLMSGPPKVRERDPSASLQGVIDPIVVLQIVAWGCGALWVFFRLYPSVIRRGLLPPVNALQTIAALLIVALSLSIWHSPGFMLTAFMLGQFVIMLAFAWVFTERFGPSTYLRHVFVGVCVLTVVLILAFVLTPGVVVDAVITNQGAQQRFRGERIAGTGPVAVLGLVCCLSNVPRLRPVPFWGSVVVFGVLLAASRMRTAYVALSVYVALGYVFGSGLRVRRMVPMLAVLCIGLIALDAFGSTTDYIVRESNSIETMSDRLPLWSFLTTAVLRDEPLVGLGYYAASRILGPQYNPGLGNAHSVFFEFLVGGGLLGAGLYVALCIALLWYGVQVLRVGRDHMADAVAVVGLLVVTIVLGLTSSEGAHAGPVGFIFWSLTAILPAVYREALVRTRDAGTSSRAGNTVTASHFSRRYPI